MLREAMDAKTTAEWRSLGFFYDRDDRSKEWRIVASVTGLRRFVSLLRHYVANPARDSEGEHDHYGPYMYLKVMTWPEAGMGSNAIYGTLADLARLADLIEVRLPRSKPGDVLKFREEYAPTAEYALVLIVKEDGFDPAMNDPSLRAGAG